MLPRFYVAICLEFTQSAALPVGWRPYYFPSFYPHSSTRVLGVFLWFPLILCLATFMAHRHRRSSTTSNDKHKNSEILVFVVPDIINFLFVCRDVCLCSSPADGQPSWWTAQLMDSPADEKFLWKKKHAYFSILIAVDVKSSTRTAAEGLVGLFPYRPP